MENKNTEKGRLSRALRLFAGLLAVLVLLLPLLYGCKKGSKSVPVKAVVPSPQVVEVKPEIPVEEVEKEEAAGYVYDRRGRRDPFKPLIETTKKTGAKGLKTTGTLQSYDITDFTVRAIARKGNRYLALLEAPDNKSFTVNKGNIIGYNNGSITDIMANEIIITEEFKDPFGKVKYRTVILELHKGEE